MNYLAHFFLQSPNPRHMAGDFLGDHVKGPLDHRFDPDITEAIRLHRIIDAFTDRHPLNQQAVGLLDRPLRRVGGIILDLAYDHYLARHWRQFANTPREQFIARCYAVLQEHNPLFPPQLLQVISLMTTENWMGDYHELEGIQAIMRRVSGRLSHPELMQGAAEAFEQLYEPWQQAFLIFFPELMTAVREYRENNQ